MKDLKMKWLLTFGGFAALFLVVLILINSVPDFTSIEVSPGKIKVERESSSYDKEFLENNLDIYQNYIQTLESEKSQISEQLQDKTREKASWDYDVFVTAIDFMSEEKFDEAIRLFDLMLEREPEDVELLVIRAGVSSDLKNYEESILYFDKAIQFTKLENKEDLSLLYGAKGEIHKFANQYDKSLENTNKAIEINSDNFLAFTFKGDLLGSMKNFNDALLSYEKALEINPNYIRALVGKGAMLSILEKPNESIIYLDKALEIEPDNVLIKDIKDAVVEQLK